MRQVIKWTIVILMSLCSGIWIGFQCQDPHTRQLSNMSIIVGMGDYPAEAFLIVNEELEEKLKILINDKLKSRIFIAVIPSIAGYEIKIGANNNSPIFNEDINNQLIEWIAERMQIHRKRVTEKQSTRINRQTNRGQKAQRDPHSNPSRKATLKTFTK